MQEMQNRFLKWAQEIKSEVNRSAYRVIMGIDSRDFVWGSNAVAANQGIAMVQAYRLTADPEYLKAAIANLDYLLGRNATGYSFVTGFGSKTPLNIHHRQSAADGIDEPIPGFLVGGPNPNQQDGDIGYPSKLPARSYVDVVESYASNEIAINWNAAMAYLVCAVEALMSPESLPQRIAE
jgi:endoglucanase